MCIRDRDKVDELQDAGLSLKEAEEQAEKWLDTQAALHLLSLIHIFICRIHCRNAGGAGRSSI